MNKRKIIIACLCAISLSIRSCVTYKASDGSVTKNRNVCKELKGTVLLYLIFVDTQYTGPWTDSDISSTFESAKTATDWLQQKAIENGTTLNFQLKYYQSGKKRTIAKDLPGKSVYGSLRIPLFGTKLLNKWGDQVAAMAGEKLKLVGEIDKSVIKRPKDRDKLIAKLRDVYNVENVALLYMVNNYYKEDLSLSMNTASNKEIEYSIISYKNPAVIAHQILNLFGASDLNTNAFTPNSKLKKLAAETWPNEVMVRTDKTVDNLEIGSLTRYLVGWSDTLGTVAQRVVNAK
jgi:hypothetical protein